MIGWLDIKFVLSSIYLFLCLKFTSPLFFYQTQKFQFKAPRESSDLSKPIDFSSAQRNAAKYFRSEAEVLALKILKFRTCENIFCHAQISHVVLYTAIIFFENKRAFKANMKLIYETRL